ncbi:MAG TPA: glycoside hydrolase family 97 catalytic domain-containing protein [Gammaproteobacteria bacterium]|nr:glycoside hydrolase family 97 catalytic domain-containing protein [Gammaproteobacteria bacterium]
MKKGIFLLIMLVMSGCNQQQQAGRISQPSQPNPEELTGPGLTSPDGKLSVQVYVTAQNTLAYTVDREMQPVILESDLGLQLTGADFTRGVGIKSRSPVTLFTDAYSMRVGKKSHILYKANEQTFTVANAQQQELAVVFRVSNDGIAFRYVYADPAIPEKQFVRETTSFRFPDTARAWLQPIAQVTRDWGGPSYEEYYEMDIPVGTPSTKGMGWAFPALFSASGNLILISESGMDGSWHASRLHHDSTGAKYKVEIPQAGEVFPGGALLAHAKDRLVSPWRIAAIGSPTTIMESTLATDVAEPAVALKSDFVKPGHASWSWALLKDDYTTFEVQKKFIDYAADMHWDYTLIDAEWDKRIGYEKLQQLVDYAASKHIGIWLWFNSSGNWNETKLTPKSELLTHKQRVAVFSRLHNMGVKGVKVDFFNGDAQSMIAYYVDILKDAAEYGLLVNFHGATLPRGWQRTYPHLMTMEAIKGFEFGTFDQKYQDPIASHAVMALFARNVFDPMDFTPMVFGDIPKIRRVTENSFELAESVLMVSGIQHFAEIPEGMATVPDYVKNFLRELPREWDDVKFIDGFPGKYIVMARQAGDAWYVAGLNAEKMDKILTLNLNFVGSKTGFMIGSGDTERSFSQAPVSSKKPQTLTLRPNAGFVMVLK